MASHVLPSVACWIQGLQGLAMEKQKAVKILQKKKKKNYLIMKKGGKEIKTTKLFKLKMVKDMCSSSPVVKGV